MPIGNGMALSFTDPLDYWPFPISTSTTLISSRNAQTILLKFPTLCPIH